MVEILIPTDDQGRPRVSITQFRTYGAADLVGDNGEDPKGCPRLYHAKYVAKDIPPEPRSSNLELGSVLHDALHVMERDDLGPEDALQLAWSPRLSEHHWPVAVKILNQYLERGGPMTRFATLEHEVDLSAQLYVDEVYGPVMMRGIVDFIGLDLDDQSVLHGVDYKSNAAPPTREQVAKDVQIKGYDWLIRENWHRWMPKDSSPRTVMHLDALRYRDIDIRFTPDEIAEWRDWAEAVCRKILRDTEWSPHLNSGCSWCPIRERCPKWLALPGTYAAMALRRTGETPDELWDRRVEFARVAKLAGDEVKSIDEKLKQAVEVNNGVLEFRGQRWTKESGWEQDVDWLRLVDILGPQIWSAVSITKTGLERAIKGLPASMQAQAMGCIRSVPAGTTIKRGKV